jgi:Fe-S cluster biosynthesis and repair protein YggX
MADPRFVSCVKLKKKLPGLVKAPLPGTLGERLYQEVSQEAWELFKKHFTMVINEMKLDLMSSASDRIFQEQIESFFWGIEPPPPPEFVPHPPTRK